MDTVLIQRHDHQLYGVFNPRGLDCDACDEESNITGASCKTCDFTVHTKCVFVLYVEETLEHPSHVGHCLKLLTTGAPNQTDPKCHLCGKNTKRILYHCSTCELNLDIDCMLGTIRAQAHLSMPWHPHPLVILALENLLSCNVCHTQSKDGYFCPLCKLVVHKECVSTFESLEINHPCHVRHPLKLLTDGAPSYTDLKCHLCRKDTEMFLYHCSYCKFNLDFDCAIREPPPVSLSNLKVHEHTLTLMPKRIYFICDACGKTGNHAPYVCLQCDSLMFHQDCAHLPRVIHVNHHDHRVAYKYPLGPGEWRCGVCWEEIDWAYGAYSCTICPDYAIHSNCATRGDVWDGKELDGVPEEVEDIEPFKINDDNTITHFGHEHNLSLKENGCAFLEDSILCGACVRPIGSSIFYSCSRDDFFLHETCANLRKKKRHFLRPGPLALLPSEYKKNAHCYACEQTCCKGFMYVDRHMSYDLLCSSITVPFIHGSHQHPLFYIPGEATSWKRCQGCGKAKNKGFMGCIKCNFLLDFRCATIPLTVTLVRYDDHPLTLCYGEKESSKLYWCDICERKTNPETWFYTCKDCGVTLHVYCVLGDIRYAKPGGKIKYFHFFKSIGMEIELLPNNRSSRPFCMKCHCRCLGLFILKVIDKEVSELFCSFYCFSQIHPPTTRPSIKPLGPPWTLSSNA